MILGILSDSHDRLDATRAAISALRAAGAERLIHCGDVGSEQILDELAGAACAFVWGNNDWDRRPLERYAHSLELQCLGSHGAIELAGKSIFVTHGDDMRVVREVLSGQQHDYLLTGHTHVQHDQRQGRVRWINPGALHRAKPKTCAVLDLSTDQLRFLPVVVA